MNNRHYYRTIVAYVLGLTGSSALLTLLLMRKDWIAGAFFMILALYLLRGLLAYIRRINRLIAAFLFVLSKSLLPPSFVAGGIRGILFIAFMYFVWKATARLGINRRHRNDLKNKNGR